MRKKIKDAISKNNGEDIQKSYETFFKNEKFQLLSDPINNEDYEESDNDQSFNKLDDDYTEQNDGKYYKKKYMDIINYKYFN